VTDSLPLTTRDDHRVWDLPPLAPLLVLRSTHVFPLGVAAVQVSDPDHVAALKALTGKGPVVIVVRADAPNAPAAAFAGRVGVAAAVIDRMYLKDDAVQVTLQGKRRVAIDAVETQGPWPAARVSPLRELDESAAELERRAGAVLRLAGALAALDPAVSPEAVENLRANTGDASHFADLVAAQLPLTLAQRDRIVAEPAAQDRLDLLADFLAASVERAQVQREVDRLTAVHVERGRRESLLRAQLDAIRRELGEDDPQRDVRELKARLEAAAPPFAARAEAARELERLGRLPLASPEWQVTRRYLDWILALPWNVLAEVRRPDPEAVRAVLDLGHVGLDDAKRRIVEYLAVRRLVPDARPPILCFVGPPGVGKTSLGRAIATAQGRPFVRLSLAGVDDEAVLRGRHRSTMGAMPGKILQEIRRAGARNPVLMIDEIDKLAQARPGLGDPSAVLLELLDPEQNGAFVDYYLDVPFDLSAVLFIATASTEPEVPEALLDRLEWIELPEYTIEEKVTIARRHLLPQLLPEHGLDAGDVLVTDEALRLIAEGYARETGVRSLRRQLAALLRRLALRKAAGAAGPWSLDAGLIDEALGAPPFQNERTPARPTIGVANGLAWTGTGGDLLPVEAIAMVGTGQFSVTGQLGAVMLESVQAAASWVRSRADDFGLRADAFRKVDVHVHFPEGGIPKDGPSAGVTIATVLASLFTQCPIRNDVAMTGEITLTGQVLAIGGLREKLGAAVRSGIGTVIIPAANERDLRDVPESVKRALRIHLVERAEEVVALALLPAGRSGGAPRGRRRALTKRRRSR
jgi:ATP-dependent Lon protease